MVANLARKKSFTKAGGWHGEGWQARVTELLDTVYANLLVANEKRKSQPHDAYYVTKRGLIVFCSAEQAEYMRQRLLLGMDEEEDAAASASAAPAPSAVAADAPAASSSAALPRNVDEAIVYVQTQLGDRVTAAESLVRRRIEERGMADWTSSSNVKTNLDAIVARILLDAGLR
jgi:pyruvate/2-oxoglutarate dehydrogenase complex dihydrolipoamide acyltransferase (E2) component